MLQIRKNVMTTYVPMCHDGLFWTTRVEEKGQWVVVGSVVHLCSGLGCRFVEGQRVREK